MTCSETQILTVSCVDYNSIYENTRFQDTIKQLAFAETLSYTRQAQAATLDSLTGTSSALGNRLSYCVATTSINDVNDKSSLDARSSIDMAVHQETVHQALRVQTALQEKLKAVKDQLSLVETALSEEKTRNGLRENELQGEIVGLQSRVESLLAKNFSLEQENKLLRDELDRTKAKPRLLILGSGQIPFAFASAGSSADSDGANRNLTVWEYFRRDTKLSIIYVCLPRYLPGETCGGGRSLSSTT